MFAFLLSPIGRYVALAGGVLLALFAVFMVLEKRAAERIQAKIDKATIEAFKTRQGVDSDAQALSDFDLCISLGGMRARCEQLRGVAKDAPAK
jgi:hypothetical protein